MLHMTRPSPPGALESGRERAGREFPLRARVAGLVRAYQQGQPRHSALLLAIQLLYAGLFSAWLVYHHTWPAPDLIALALLGFAFLAARLVSFLRDWSPFVLLLLGYVALAGIDGGVTARAHVQFPISVDEALFHGAVPTVWLQAHLWNPQQLHWYDYLASVLYPMHFIVPLVLAFAFWMWRKRVYWRFVSSYLLLCYAGFATYLLFPMAPPWWAYRVGKLPPVHLVLYEVHYDGVQNPIVLATQFFKPNPVAAMPSLHAAVPVLIWLTLWKTWPRWGWAAIIYPVAMGLTVVYLGEHYVIDVLAGWLYAFAAFAVVWRNERGAPGEDARPEAGADRVRKRSGRAGALPASGRLLQFPERG